MATARSRKKTTAKTDVGGVVIGSTAEEQKKESYSGADVVTLRVSLRNGYAMDDIPNGNGGTKVVVLPGLDDALRGKRQGILTPDGNAVFFQLKRADWDAIKAIHGQERMFKGWKGFPPCVAEVDADSAKAGAYNDEIKATKTGLDATNPADVDVTEAKKGE
jgi:hypothetical protein